MSVCIAAVCVHEGKHAVVTCTDFQGTRGGFLKADDTGKMRHFDKAIILVANEMSAGAEFAARCEEVLREFDGIEKKEGDIDLRFGIYLSKLRDLVRKFIRERQDHAITTKFGLTLNEFYSIDAPKRHSIQERERIFTEIQKTDLGAEFIIVYMGDAEPILIQIIQDGYVSLEENDFLAIGSGGLIAMAAFELEYRRSMSLPECILRVFQAKLWAEKNPYVGTMTMMHVILQGGQLLFLSNEAWDILAAMERQYYSPEADLKKLAEIQWPIVEPGSIKKG